MITHLDADAVRYEGGRPVAAGDQGRDGEERQAVGSLLPYLGGDDPGKATGAPRSQAEAGPPPTYWLSDQRNAPPASEPPSPAEQAGRPDQPEG